MQLYLEWSCIVIWRINFPGSSLLADQNLKRWCSCWEWSAWLPLLMFKFLFSNGLVVFIKLYCTFLLVRWTAVYWAVVEFYDLNPKSCNLITQWVSFLICLGMPAMLIDLLWQSLPITAKDCGFGSCLWFIRYIFILLNFPVICIKSVIFSAVSSTNKIDLNITEMLLNVKLYSHMPIISKSLWIFKLRLWDKSLKNIKKK